MPRSARKLLTVCTLASLLLFSCKKQPPKEPEPEPDPFAGVTEKEPTPPPPAPKCESLDEKCMAEADTWVEVGDGAKFQPAEGWTYAKLEGVSVAKAEGGAAGIAYRIVSAPLEPKKDATGVIDALKPVFESLSAEVSEKSIKKQLKKDGVVDDKGSLALSTWQLEGKVGGEDGIVIIVVTSLGSGEGLVGAVALQKATVQDNLEAVQKAYRSVRSTQ
jgi:hypothetical protein